MKPRLRLLAACLLVPAVVLAILWGKSEPLPDVTGLPPALAALGARAAHGDTTAQDELGQRYRYGDGVPKDMDAAVRWYRAAAKHGCAKAQYHLATTYSIKIGVSDEDPPAVVWLNSHLPFVPIPTAREQNKAEWKRWLRTAAENGEPDAQSILASDYFHGMRGFPRDQAEAAKWYAKAFASYRKAADKGSAHAEYELSILYLDGYAVRADVAVGMKWLNQAAEHGYKYAQFELARRYDRGEDMPKDEAVAAQWYRRAADQGHADAQYCLGVMYLQGRGLPKDGAEAVKWLRKAAAQRTQEAFVVLGCLYRDGSGVPKDEVEAWKWWWLATKAGEAGTFPEMEALKARLTPEQRAEAQRRAMEYKASRAKDPDAREP